MGRREPHEVKKKSFDLGGIQTTTSVRIRSTVTLPIELRGRRENVGDDIGGESRRRESKGTMNVNNNNNTSYIAHLSITMISALKGLLTYFLGCVAKDVMVK